MAWDDDSYFEGAGTPYQEVVAGWAKDLAAPAQAALAAAMAASRLGDGHCVALAETKDYFRLRAEWLPSQLAEKSAADSVRWIVLAEFAEAVGAALPESGYAQDFARGEEIRGVRRQREAWDATLAICRAQFDAGQPITGKGSQSVGFSDNRFAALAALRSST